ncbi:MAG: TetR/AcrR family transcriptional regulator [Gordonia sp. (in: high G+C Gram-positive bacteria)]|uniref:TetR/AcrR family transcriptional regulator n=1 Tax=Gordonia sp. (in: high G+C Gram-positive bacteria) TaxID=84139 RepID=UPI0039E30EC8
MTIDDEVTPARERPAAERRRRMSPAERRRQLLDLGLDLARRLPPEDVTMEVVAEAAGVSRGLMFHYFESKQDFHLAILREQAGEMLALTRPPEGLEDPNEIALASLSAYVEYVEANPTAYSSLLRGALSGDPEIRAVTEETRTEVARRVLAFAPAMGIDASPMIEAAVMGWIAFVEEVMTRWIADPVMRRDQVLALITTSLLAIAGVAGSLEG